MNNPEKVLETMRLTWGIGDRWEFRCTRRYLMEWTEGRVAVPTLICRLLESTSILRVKLTLHRKMIASHLLGVQGVKEFVD